MKFLEHIRENLINSDWLTHDEQDELEEREDDENNKKINMCLCIMMVLLSMYLISFYKRYKSKQRAIRGLYNI